MCGNYFFYSKARLNTGVDASNNLFFFIILAAFRFRYEQTGEETTFRQLLPFLATCHPVSWSTHCHTLPRLE